MENAVEQKLANILDALQNGVVEIDGQAIKYAPDVVGAAEAVVRLDGIQSLVIGGALLALSVCSYYVFRGAVKQADELSIVPDVSAAAIAAVGLPSFFIAAWNLLDVWAWAAIFVPRLYIAHKIIESAL